jgi:hypothetical protein
MKHQGYVRVPGFFGTSTGDSDVASGSKWTKHCLSLADSFAPSSNCSPVDEAPMPEFDVGCGQAVATGDLDAAAVCLCPTVLHLCLSLVSVGKQWPEQETICACLSVWHCPPGRPF